VSQATVVKVTTDQGVINGQAGPTSALPEKKKHSSEIHHLSGGFQLTEH
jgi:hypothetical protein